MTQIAISENHPTRFQREGLDLVNNLVPLSSSGFYLVNADMQQLYRLTDRELDVVELIVAGASNKLIASELNLSLATVKTHLQQVFHKFGVSSRTAVSAMVLGALEG